ncbi:MAG: hypothetical protein NVSMB27_05610 [Ktedonobacteraceae bacterium]
MWGFYMAKGSKQPASGESKPFQGFETPSSNYFRLPNAWTDITAQMRTWAEQKVVEYVLRHTWGYQEYGIKRRITLDEFMSGRKHKDGTRIDRGTGMGKKAIIDGIRAAIDQGFLEEQTDATDAARIRKYYSLRMQEPNSEGFDEDTSGVRLSNPGVRTANTSGSMNEQRSEKDTLERQHTERNLDNSNIRKTSISKQNQDHKELRQTSESDREAPIAQAPDQPALRKVKPSQAGFTSVGALLPQMPLQAASTEHSGASQGGSRTGPHIEVPAQIRQIVEQVTEEFHDNPEKALANLTRAMNLYARSGLSEYGFCRVLAEAQGVTKRAGSIQKLSTQPGWQGLKNKVPYFFVVVENRLKELRMEEEQALP